MALAAIVIRRLGTERIADLVRWVDQRLDLFSPRGAGLYARFAVPLLRSLYERVAEEVAAVAPEMLATAEDRARGAGVADRVAFRVADAAALPLADGSVDVAVSTLSLHHWRDVPAILRELHRVVRPGGHVLIYDPRLSYSARQFASFVAQTLFTGGQVAYAPMRAGSLPFAAFTRFELARG